MRCASDGRGKTHRHRRPTLTHEADTRSQPLPQPGTSAPPPVTPQSSLSLQPARAGLLLPASNPPGPPRPPNIPPTAVESPPWTGCTRCSASATLQLRSTGATLGPPKSEASRKGTAGCALWPPPCMSSNGNDVFVAWQRPTKQLYKPPATGALAWMGGCRLYIILALTICPQ